MDVRTRIRLEARARGMTAAEVARRLGGYRSNLSAMDAGRRPVSIRGLARVAALLGCSPADLIEVGPDLEAPLFGSARLEARLLQREADAADGAEKGWVHAVRVAWCRHVGTPR